MKLSQYGIHRIVEYIRAVGVDFDAADVEEDVMAVLMRYGFCDGFSDADLEALGQELLPLGLRQELAEISRAYFIEPLEAD